jgi:hypothetical protein
MTITTRAHVTKRFGIDEGFEDLTSEEVEDLSRRQWQQSQGLHPRPAAQVAPTMDADTQRRWDNWAQYLINTAINTALRAHTKYTQDFVVSFVREVNKHQMERILTLRDEINQLRQQLREKEMKDGAK